MPSADQPGAPARTPSRRAVDSAWGGPQADLASLPPLDELSLLEELLSVEEDELALSLDELPAVSPEDAESDEVSLDELAAVLADLPVSL